LRLGGGSAAPPGGLPPPAAAGRRSGRCGPAPFPPVSAGPPLAVPLGWAGPMPAADTRPAAGRRGAGTWRFPLHVTPRGPRCRCRASPARPGWRAPLTGLLPSIVDDSAKRQHPRLRRVGYACPERAAGDERLLSETSHKCRERGQKGSRRAALGGSRAALQPMRSSLFCQKANSEFPVCYKSRRSFELHPLGRSPEFCAPVANGFRA
jgi:hypothetical protein